MNIHVGDEIELTEEVVPENTAEKWGSGSLPVYATPAMISLTPAPARSGAGNPNGTFRA